MNLGNLTTYASLFATDINQTRYAGQYTNVANLAQQQFALDTKALFKNITWTIIANTPTYALPTDFMWEKMIMLNGLELKPINRFDLGFYKRASDWTLDTGTPKNYVTDPEIARQQLLLYPNPQGADAASANNLVMTYYPLPADMVSATDIPLNATVLLAQFHVGIAAYMAWLLLQTENSSQEIETKKSGLWKIYQDNVTEAIDRFGNTASAPIRMKGGRSWL